MNDDFIKKQKEVVSDAFEKSKNLSNIVMMAGYAGLFGIWNMTKDILIPLQSTTAALFLTVSLISYVFFEVFVMIIRVNMINTLQKELSKAEKMHEFPETYGKEAQKHKYMIMVIWPYFLLFNISTALISGAILIYAFVSDLYIELSSYL